MKPTFDSSLFTEVAVHSSMEEGLSFIADASELRLPPGKFPESFFVSPKMGNGKEFSLFTINMTDGGSRLYYQVSGYTQIRIMND